MPGSATAVEIDQKLTVLVVDDEPDMRLVIGAYLARAGVVVIDEAVDGPEAIEALHRLDPPRVPTVVVLDNRMPTLSGLEVAERVLGWAPGQRIVLFSAYLTPEIEQQAATLGIRACLSKTDVARLPELVVTLAAS